MFVNSVTNSIECLVYANWHVKPIVHHPRGEPPGGLGRLGHDFTGGGLVFEAIIFFHVADMEVREIGLAARPRQMQSLYGLICFGNVIISFSI